MAITILQDENFTGIAELQSGIEIWQQAREKISLAEPIRASEIEFDPTPPAYADFLFAAHEYATGSQLRLLAPLAAGNLEITAARFRNLIYTAADTNGFTREMTRIFADTRAFEVGLKNLSHRDSSNWEIRKGKNLENPITGRASALKAGNIYGFTGEPLGNHLAMTLAMTEALEVFEQQTMQGVLFRDVIAPHNVPDYIGLDHTRNMVRGINWLLSSPGWVKQQDLLHTVNATQIDNTIARWQKLDLIEADFNVYKIDSYDAYDYAVKVADYTSTLPAESYDLRGCRKDVVFAVTDAVQQLQLTFGNDCPIAPGLLRALTSGDLDHSAVLEFINYMGEKTTAEEALEELQNVSTYLISNYTWDNFANNEFTNAFSNLRGAVVDREQAALSGSWNFKKLQVPIKETLFPFRDFVTHNPDNSLHPNIVFAKKLIAQGRTIAHHALKDLISEVYGYNADKAQDTISRLTTFEKMTPVNSSGKKKDTMGVVKYLRLTDYGRQVFSAYCAQLQIAYRRYLDLIADSQDFVYEVFNDVVESQVGDQAQYTARNVVNIHPYRSKMIAAVLNSFIVSQMSGT